MDIYFAVVSTANTPMSTFMLETRYMGSVSAYRVEDISRQAVPLLISRPAMSNNIIYHLLYREGKSIVGKEPLLMPQGLRTGIKDNPNDPVNFTAFYIGITTDFWVRACQHYQKGYKRMYVVYRSILPPQTASNLEILTIRHFIGQPHIPAINNKTLINDNKRAGELDAQEYLYLIFK
jgi:hypothetical protein